jgi:DNA-binding winged helix-turn-helix (wHTH) protein
MKPILEGELEFAGFRLDPAARQLTRLDGTPVKLNSRAFDTLAVLVARPAHTLTKRFLLHQVWPDVVVGDNNLNQAVAAIRKVLGDSDEPRRIIQTVSGRGFCCVAEVQVREKNARAPAIHANHRDTIVTVADYF